MSNHSWSLRRSPLVVRAATVQLLVLLLLLAATALVGRAVGASASYPLEAGAVFAAIQAVALGYLHLHPFDDFGPANHLTTFRALQVAMVAGLVVETPTEPVAWVAALTGVGATVLDGVDGWLARRSGMASAFGARYDMEVDALLILVLAVLAWRLDKAELWIVTAGAMRYAFVAAGRAWGWLSAPLPPSTRRKAVCVVQIVGLGLVVAPFVPSDVSPLLAGVTLLVLLWSFGVDVLWLRRHSA
jgi:phosphatidylglycerophosphate synthase